MEAIDGYNLVMSCVEQLRKQGIKVNITPTRSRNNQDTVEKYSGKPGHLTKDYWNHVTIFPLSEEDWKILRILEGILHNMECYFDTGYGCGGRDWEIDWSFRVKE